MIALLPLLLAAAPVATPDTSPRASKVATATVQIIRLEPVSLKAEHTDSKTADRQYRRRDAMPLIEFF